MSEVLEKLFLGSINYSKDAAFIKSKNIKFILIAAKGLG